MKSLQRWWKRERIGEKLRGSTLGIGSRILVTNWSKMGLCSLMEIQIELEIPSRDTYSHSQKIELNLIPKIFPLSFGFLFSSLSHNFLILSHKRLILVETRMQPVCIDKLMNCVWGSLNTFILVNYVKIEYFMSLYYQ